MFRVPGSNALINRMGFNNKGVDHLVSRLANASYRGIRGVSIGKNFDTPDNSSSRPSPRAEAAARGVSLTLGSAAVMTSCARRLSFDHGAFTE